MTTKHFIPFFLEAHNTAKMMHWFTASFAEHMALDKFTDIYLPLTDKFVEVYIGKHGRTQIARRDFAFNYVSSTKLSSFLDDSIRYCSNDLNKFITSKDTDLANIRDEIIAALNQTKYLASLR